MTKQEPALPALVICCLLLRYDFVHPAKADTFKRDLRHPVRPSICTLQIHMSVCTAHAIAYQMMAAILRMPVQHDIQKTAPLQRSCQTPACQQVRCGHARMASAYLQAVPQHETGQQIRCTAETMQKIHIEISRTACTADKDAVGLKFPAALLPAQCHYDINRCRRSAVAPIAAAAGSVKLRSRTAGNIQHTVFSSCAAVSAGLASSAGSIGFVASSSFASSA